MQNTSSAIGQLVLVYKRVTALAGFTSRVSELLESVSFTIDAHFIVATHGLVRINCLPRKQVKQLSTKEGQHQRAAALQKLVETNDVTKMTTYTAPILKFGPSIEYVY